MDNAAPITFAVRYRLGEYLRFVTEHGFDSDATLLEQLVRDSIAQVRERHD